MTCSLTPHKTPFTILRCSPQGRLASVTLLRFGAPFIPTNTLALSDDKGARAFAFSASANSFFSSAFLRSPLQDPYRHLVKPASRLRKIPSARRREDPGLADDLSHVSRRISFFFSNAVLVGQNSHLRKLLTPNAPRRPPKVARRFRRFEPHDQDIHFPH